MRARMHAALRRAPTAGDLYIAHVFGPEAAIALITAAPRRQTMSRPRHFPELARRAAGIIERATHADDRWRSSTAV